MKDSKFNVGMYFFALFGGLASGLLFSKSQYYKGQSDAYDEVADQLKESIDNIEKMLDEQEEAE